MPYIERLVPTTFRRLEQALNELRQRTPLLLLEKLRHVAASCNIVGLSALQEAVRTLHVVGSLMHFNVSSGGLYDFATN